MSISIKTKIPQLVTLIKVKTHFTRAIRYYTDTFTMRVCVYVKTITEQMSTTTKKKQYVLGFAYTYTES